MDGKSADIRQAQLDRLRELFPEVVSEGKIDWEKLRLTLGEDITIDNERYVLNWAGKSDAFRAIQTPTTATLKPQPEQSVDFENTRNIFIEGENLEVLKVLQKSYYGKVKMICIDPPYNTGNDSFIYPDKFSESKDEYLRRIGDKDEAGYLTKEGFFRKNSRENGQYHSNWLSMMYPRLFLARNLLRDDGVIFVSIDDNEVHNLRLMMNEIFGEENFVASVVWQKRTSPDARLRLGPAHDYLLVYCRAIEMSGDAFRLLPLSEERQEAYGNPDNDPRGPWASRDMTGQVGHATPSQFYEITTPAGVKYSPPEGRCWAISKGTVQKLVSDNRIWFGKDGKTRPRLKLFLSESKGTPSWTWWANEEVGHNQEATKELNALMGMGEVFDNPKPTRLIKRILQLSTFNENSDIVLDFFAGSGTTAQAVMELNKEDGGNRQFILVQLPEKTDEESEAHKAGYKTIADICKERIRRAGRKMSEPLITQMAADNADKKKRQLTMELTASSADKESAASDSSKLSAVGFKVFTLQPSNFKVWRTDTIENGDDLVKQMDAFADPVRAGSDADAMAWEILVKSGYELTTKMEKLKLGVATQSGAKNTPTMSLPHDSSGNPAVPRDGFPIGAFGNDSTVSSEKGQNNSVPMYSIAGGEVILALEKISQKAIDDVVKMKPKLFICLDRLFAGNDQLKTNTALQMRDAGVEFKTV